MPVIHIETNEAMTEDMLRTSLHSNEAQALDGISADGKSVDVCTLAGKEIATLTDIRIALAAANIAILVETIQR